MTEVIRIAVASGKGGTGKTTLATNLAVFLAAEGEKVAYLDCDVEEPNGHIFLDTEISRHSHATIPVPEVDESKCNYCRACSEACRFSAILVLEKKVLTFPKLCHGCGGCALVCPEDAIRELPRSIGVVEEGIAIAGSGRLNVVQGRLEVGEAMSPPLIREVRKKGEAVPGVQVVIIDSPPGTSCPVIESVRDADVVLLVTEPTPFGLNDLKLAVETVRTLGLMFGVVVNRAGLGDRSVYEYCSRENIPVLLEIPDDRRIAEAYSQGKLLLKELPELRPLFTDLADGLRQLAGGARLKADTTVEVQQEPEESFPLPSAGLPPGQASDVKELVVVSGKGGTGKTSVVASFFALAERAAVADCDVDAADLHLLLDPAVEKRWKFSGGHEAHIDIATCDGCGLCVEHCRFDAIASLRCEDRETFQVDPIMCEGCGVCASVCPFEAVKMNPSASGEWFVSATGHGPMAHARLGIAQENSGKLVSLVRREGRALAATRGCKLLIVDGSPGIGCSVIASITGAWMVLVVTEPSLSGLHDLGRVAELTHHFGVNTAVCINKADINPDMAKQIRQAARKMDIPVLGHIRYDTAVTWAQVHGKAVVEGGTGVAADDIRRLWNSVKDAID